MLVPRRSTRLKRRARSRMTYCGLFKRLPWVLLAHDLRQVINSDSASRYAWPFPSNGRCDMATMDEHFGDLAVEVGDDLARTNRFVPTPNSDSAERHLKVRKAAKTDRLALDAALAGVCDDSSLRAVDIVTIVNKMRYRWNQSDVEGKGARSDKETLRGVGSY
jgi:hypothetical protein